MKVAFLLLLTIQLVFSTSWDDYELDENSVEEQAVENEKLKKEILRLGRQMMLQQFFTEERIRSEGNSGIKQVRVGGRSVGLKSYYSSTHSGSSIASIHDHANNIRTVGMGEVTVVLNGVEFRTRHNDYRLYMPSETSILSFPYFTVLHDYFSDSLSF